MGVPTYSVRFESQDDFLVEYTDRLRHGQALLPLPKPLAPGTPVRLKVHLPDGQLLYILGSAIAPARPVAPSINAASISWVSAVV